MVTWAEENIVLPEKTSSIHGRYSSDYTPWMRRPMRLLSSAGPAEVIMQKCSQSSGSTTSLNWLGYLVAVNPGPTLCVMPRETDVKRRVRTRIRPMFKDNPDLATHLPRGNTDNLNIGHETELDNMILYLAWSGSPAAVADNPVQNVILDEVGKFPAKSKNEADAVLLARKRQRTYKTTAKTLIISTPVYEGDLINREFENGSQEYWWARCPDCGDYHCMDFASIAIDRDPEGKFFEPDKYITGRMAHYCCPVCGSIWDESKRWQAVSDGIWVPFGCEAADGKIKGDVPSTRRFSFQISAWMLHPAFQTIGELAADWVRAQIALKAGDTKPLQDVINSEFGQPWKIQEKKTDIDVVSTHIGGYEQGVVPDGVEFLTLGIDVQLDHIWYRVIGWGYLFESWAIEEGRIETGDTNQLENYALVRELLSMQYPMASDPNRSFAIKKTAIDSQYRTDIVEDFCKQCREADIVPVRGDDSVKSKIYRTVRLPGDITRYDLNVNDIKSRLYRLIFEAERPGGGYHHLHRDTSEDTLKQLCSEEQIQLKKGSHVYYSWEPKKGRPANHLWDCTVYATFAAELAGVRMLRDPAVKASGRVRKIGKLNRFK